MPEFEYIKSKENQTLKFIAKLQSSCSARTENRKIVIEGLRLCRDAVQNGFSVNILAVTETAYNSFESDIKQISEYAERCILLDNELFLKISDTKTPQGILCVCDMVNFEGSVDKLQRGKFIVLENLQDPSNLGAVSRTAEALGIDGIILSNNSCDPYSPKSLRASMGALLRIPVFVSNNFISDMNALKQNGFTLYATVPNRSAVNLTEITFPAKCVALIGNEANGLTEQAKLVCNKTVTIPMKGKAESLNAATAASIVMWEMVK